MQDTRYHHDNYEDVHTWPQVILENPYTTEDPGLAEEVYISIVVPISESYSDLERLFLLHEKELLETGKNFEFIFILDGDYAQALHDLQKLKEKHTNICILKIKRSFGEATALSIGFAKAKGTYIITLTPYLQVEPDGLREVLNKLQEGHDLVITRRFPRVDPVLNRLQTMAFHWLVRKLTGLPFHDMACGLRGMHRRVVQELNLYGDLHRFIPVLAHMQGFKVIEIDVRQCPENAVLRTYGLGVYLRRLLDILSIFFLFKFTTKPLRFFGLIGSAFFSVGFLLSLYLSILRLAGETNLTNRPLLLLGLLMIVLGIQITSLGLVGEMIVFTQAGKMREYHIDTVLE
jgi:glycosyltransferase involved in cell wall biosynthesis